MNCTDSVIGQGAIKQYVSFALNEGLNLRLPLLRAQEAWSGEHSQDFFGPGCAAENLIEAAVG
jgi:hypothetical protein